MPAELNVGINGKNATKGAKDVNSALDSIGNKSRSLISTAINPLTVAIGGIASYQTISGLVNSADKFTTIAAQLEYVTGSSVEAEEAQAMLYDMSQKTGTSITANSDALVKLSGAQEMMGTTTAENVEILGGMNALMLKTGTSGASAAAATQQLTQALASGVLAGDEFKSINENAPALMKAFAEALGVPRGELKALAAEGKITTEIMTQALKGIAAEGATSFDSLPKTAESGWTRVTNAFQTAWDRINDKTGIMSFIFEALIDLSTWIEENSPIFTLWVENFVTKLRENWPEIKQHIGEIGEKIFSLWENIGNALPSMGTFFKGFGVVVQETAKYVEAFISLIDKAITGWKMIIAMGTPGVQGVDSAGNQAYINDITRPVSMTPEESYQISNQSSNTVNINVNQNVSRSDVVNIANEMQLRSSRE